MCCIAKFRKIAAEFIHSILYIFQQNLKFICNEQTLCNNNFDFLVQRRQFLCSVLCPKKLIIFAWSRNMNKARGQLPNIHFSNFKLFKQVIQDTTIGQNWLFYCQANWNCKRHFRKETDKNWGKMKNFYMVHLRLQEYWEWHFYSLHYNICAMCELVEYFGRCPVMGPRKSMAINVRKRFSRKYTFTIVRLL